MGEVQRIVEVVKEHAAVFWQYTKEELGEVELTKVDVTMDLLGGFMTQGSGEDCELIRELLCAALGEVFGTPETNFLSLGRLGGFEVRRGDNPLDSC